MGGVLYKGGGRPGRCAQQGPMSDCCIEWEGPQLLEGKGSPLKRIHLIFTRHNKRILCGAAFASGIFRDCCRFRGGLLQAEPWRAGVGLVGPRHGGIG